MLLYIQRGEVKLFAFATLASTVGCLSSPCNFWAQVGPSILDLLIKNLYIIRKVMLDFIRSHSFVSAIQVADVILYGELAALAYGVTAVANDIIQMIILAKV